MNVYWFIAIFTLLLNRLMPCKTDKSYLRNLIISFTPLFIYAAIRVDYGNDYPAYEAFFDTFHASGRFIPDYDAHAEVGYQFLCYIMPSFRSMLVLNGFILSIAMAYFVYKNIPSQYACLVIFLIFLMPEKNIFGSLVGMRHGFVVTTFLLTFIFVQQRKWYLVLPVAFILDTIHSSALAYIPLAYVVARDTPVTKKELYFWIGSGIAVMILSTSTLAGLIAPFVSLISGSYEEQLMGMDEISRGLINYIASMIMMVSFMYFAYARDAELSPNQKSLLRMAALYCVSGCLGSLSGRMTYYFAMYYIGGVVVMYSYQWKNEQLKKVMLLFVILVASYATFFVWMGAPWWNHGTYHSLFD